MGKKPRDSSCGSLEGSEVSSKVQRIGGSPPTVVSAPTVEGKGRKGIKGARSRDRSSGADGDLAGRARSARGLSATGGARGKGSESIRLMRALTSEILDVVVGEAITQGGLKSVLGLVGRFEDIVLGVLLENELLKGKLEAMETCGFSRRVPVASGAVAAPSAPVVPTPLWSEVASKPVETWSVVVQSGDTEATPEEVVEKVKGEVAPALGVRVHALKPIKGVGAVIRTPSVSERDRILSNEKFKEVGLKVSVNKARAERIVVIGVDSAITPEVFMDELYLMNLKEVMSVEEFRKEVHIVGVPWKKDAGSVNVILEANSIAIGTLLRIGHCYIKWFAFRMRRYNSIQGCFRCFGFGHFASECRVEGVVCRRCGEVGHLVWECTNAVSCRNCVFKGLPAGHRMMSMDCPLYCGQVARVNSRH